MATHTQKRMTKVTIKDFSTILVHCNDVTLHNQNTT